MISTHSRRIWPHLAFSAVIALSLLFSFSDRAFAAFGDGSPTVPNASVFTAQTEDAKVDGSTGAFTQSVPLDIPPGRNGLQPDISLDYNSQRTKDSVVGYGWSLSIPYIERLNKTGTEDLYGSLPYFTSSIDGELVASSTSSGTTTASVSIETNSYGSASTVMCSSVSSVTLSKSVSATSTLLVVHIDSPFVSTVQYAGVDMTLSTSTGGVGTWYLANPTSGTNNVSVTFSPNSGGYVSAVSYTGTDTTDPIGAMAYNTGSTGNTSVLITTESNYSFVDDQVFYDQTQTLTANSPQIQQLTTGCSGNFSHGASVLKTTSSGLQSLGWTHVGNNGAWIEIAVEVKAPSSSTGSAGSYLAVIDDGSFNAYNFATTSWTMYDKRGTRYTFGSDDSGRMYDTNTGTSTNTYRWMLQEVRDTNGNYIEYSYARDNNILYPATITYTGNGSTDGPFTITFASSTRPDTRISYASGFAATTTKRIHEIDASVNGSIVRKYLLGYGTGNNGSRSLLTSVVQQGYDDNGTLVTLPAFTFSYASSSTQYFGPAGAQLTNASYVAADTDGNGINDVNLFMPGAGNGFLWHDNASSAIAVPDASSPPPDFWASTGYPNQVPLERGVRYLDINGDGKADTVRGWVDDAAGTSNYAIKYNEYATTTDTYSWSATSTSYTGDVPIFAKKTSGGLYLTGGLFGDVNADGLPDYLTALAGQIATSTYLGNGSAWDRSVTVFPAAKSFPSTAPTETASQLVDINGDNLDDWVYSAASSTYVLLNNGTGWNSVPTSQWTFATSTTYLSNGNYYDRGIRFMDMNGDGLQDLVRSYYGASGGGCIGTEVADVKAVYLNTGSGWATTTRYTLPAYIATCNAGTSTIAYNEFVNFYGNGQMKQDVITNVTNPKGGGIAVTYTMAGNPGSAIRVLGVATTTAHDGLGNYATTTYSYSNGHWYNTTVRDRRFAGFSPVTTTNPDSIVTTYYGQNTLARIGRPTRKDISDPSSNLKQRALYRWDTVTHAGDSTFIGLGREVTLDYASDGTHRDKATDYRYSSTTDDLIQKIEYGEVTGNADSADFTDTGTDKRTTIISYAASTSVNMYLPTQKTVLDYSGATSTDQKLYYDSLAFGSVNAGNVTKQEDWISGTTYASTTKTYNAYGLVATSTDRRGNATSYVYDANNLYVATSTNPLLQKTEFLYNYANGKVRWKKDPNASLTKNVFDGVGRLKEVDVSATSSPTMYATTTVYTYTDSTTTPSTILRSDWLFPSNTMDTYQYFDGFNRVAQERRESPDSNQYFVSDRRYSQAGLLASSTLPYASSGSAYTTPTTVSNLYTNYLYDSLKRLTSEANAVGTKTNAYSKWMTTATDPNSNVKVYWYDAFGNLENVVERISASSIATTTYTYDVQSNLSTTTDSRGNVRGFTHDGLGRRLSAQDLHYATDTTFGIWSYTYDDAGNLKTQTDPKSQTVSRTYDALNRMLTEDYTGGSGTEVTLVYDSCSNGIGYLCSASSTAATTTNAYDIFGRLASATTTVLNTSYNMQYSYDRQGNVTSWTYPNGTVATVNYNNAGLPSSVQRKPSGGSFSDIVSSLTYSPTGQSITTVFGNGASTTRTYNVDALYRLSNLKTLANGSNVQDFTYTYDSFGNITQMANTGNASSSATTVFSYDALHRLLFASTTAAVTAPYLQTYTYDLLGSILTLSSGASSTLASSPRIMDSIPSASLQHNTEAGTSLSFSYTVPSGGSNKLLVVLFGDNSGGSGPTAISQNGVDFTSSMVHHEETCSPGMKHHYFAYLANPSSGTFSMTWSGSTYSNVAVFTVQDAAQSNPIDVENLTCATASTKSTSVTTTQGNDLLLSYTAYQSQGALTSFGSGEAEVTNGSSAGFNSEDYVAWKAAGPSAGTETMTSNLDSSRNIDHSVIAVKGASSTPGASPSVLSYTYANTGYANPHAVTEISNGVSTTTFSYDNNGNLSQKVTDGVATTYLWDYANRLTALGVNNSTTTYGYDAFSARVYQIASTTATTTYASKWYSVASSTRSGTNYATSTEYLFNGDTLLSTVDQAFTNGTATGTAAVRYIHPDHLGSTNIVTNADGTAIVQTLDYYPYGATRIDGGTDVSGREFIGQFSDDSGLSYLNARYYDGNRAQFLSQDPVFLFVGNPTAIWQMIRQTQYHLLSDPQQLNGYGYARDNPISNTDPTGEAPKKVEAVFKAIEIISNAMLGRATDDMLTVSPGETPAELASDQAKFNVEFFLFGAGAAAGGTSLAGVGINVGGIMLDRIDAWCAKHECRNLDTGNLTPQQIADSVISGKPLPPPTSSGSSGGGGGSRPAQQQSTQQSTSQQASGQTSQGSSGSGSPASNSSFAAQIAAIQARINVIRTQLNALIQRAAGQPKTSR